MKNNPTQKLLSNSLVRLSLFCLGSFLLFSPALGRTFSSDDFQVVKRVGLDKAFRTPGFFRLLSDVTLYINFQLGAFEPAGYYLFNILVHGVNSYLVFLFCLKWEWTTDNYRQKAYAFIAALLFLTYPFHNEGIVWVLGRGASLCTLFALAALLAVVSDFSRGRKMFWSCLFYFAGMAVYEPILPLPIMLLIVVYNRQAGRKEMIDWALVSGGTLLVHLILRVVVSGSLTGGYGKTFFESGWKQYAGNILKVAGRLFLPPAEHSGLMALLFIILLITLSLVTGLFLRRYAAEPGKRGYLSALFFLLVCASIMPVLSAVSTKTSESDRLLYFPSVFLCGGLSFLGVNLIRSRRWLMVSIIILSAYYIVFLEANNLNWVKASAITRNIVGVIVRQDPVRKIFIVNLPDERDGAFIFRLGLPEALLISGKDTSGLVVINHLTRDQSLKLPDSIRAERREGEWYLAPDVTIRRWGQDSLKIEVSNSLPPAPREAQYWLAGKNDIVLYWNRKSLVRMLFF